MSFSIINLVRIFLVVSNVFKCHGRLVTQVARNNLSSFIRNIVQLVRVIFVPVFVVNSDFSSRNPVINQDNCLFLIIYRNSKVIGTMSFSIINLVISFLVVSKVIKFHGRLITNITRNSLSFWLAIFIKNILQVASFILVFVVNSNFFSCNWFSRSRLIKESNSLRSVTKFYIFEIRYCFSIKFNMF